MSKKILWPFLILSYLSLLAHAMLDNTRSAVYPDFLSFFKVQPSAGSAIFSLSTFAGILICMTSRYWLPRLGNIRAIRMGLSLLFLSGLFYFIIPVGIPSFSLFLFFSFLLGIGVSLVSISMNLLVGTSTPLHLRQRAFSGLHAIYGLGSLTAPLLYGLWVARGREWPEFFLLLSVIPLIGLLYSFSVSGRDTAKEEKAKLVPPVGFKMRIAVGTMFGFYVGSEVLLSSRLVFYLQNELHFSLKTSQYYLSFFFLCLFLGRLLSAFFPACIKTTTAMTLSLGLTFLFLLLGIHATPVFLSLSGFSMSWFFPLGMVWLMEKYKDGYGYMTGSVFAWVGGYLFFAHSLFGFMATYTSLKAAIHIAPILSLGTLIFLIFLKRTE